MTSQVYFLLLVFLLSLIASQGASTTLSIRSKKQLDVAPIANPISTINPLSAIDTLDNGDMFDNITISDNSTSDDDKAKNTTSHAGFLHGFVESLSVILVSELGDKTFFIAAILAMRNNRLTVFLAAMSALAVMTVLSAVLGFVVTTFIPRVYTYYTCTAIMFLFGIKMLWEAWRMKDTEGEETQREVEEELERRGSTSGAEASSSGEVHEPTEMVTLNPADLIQGQENCENSEDKMMKSRLNQNKSFTLQMREKSWFGKKCVKIFKVFTNTFGMTFLAEWGDRSQLATIVMAGINDVAGVCLGGVLGHFICTGLAVICGALIAKKISVRMVTLVGAVVFIGFAITSIFIDPYDENEHVPKIEGADLGASNLTMTTSSSRNLSD